MKKTLLLGVLGLGLWASANAQVYTADLSQDNAGDPGFWGTGAPGYSTAFADAEKTTVALTREPDFDKYASISLGFNDAGEPISTIDMSNAADNVIYIVAKSPNAGTKLRVDVKDDQGYVTNTSSLRTPALTTEYKVYTLSPLTFTDSYTGGGFSGDCTPSPDAPCTVNKAAIKELLFSINDGSEITENTVVDIAAIQIGGVFDAILNKANVYSIEMSPNPSSEFTTLNYYASSETVVTVSDLKGSVLKSVKGSNTTATINTSDLTSGLYVVTVVVNGVPSAVEKLVVR